MSLADRILFVALDELDLPVFKFDFESTNGFAQVAGDVVSPVVFVQRICAIKLSIMFSQRER